MSVDKKIIEELNRYRSINKYIMEQDVPPPPGGDVPPPPPVGPEAGAPPTLGGAVPPPPGGEEAAGPTPVDVENDPDVEKIGGQKKGEGETEDTGTEELDITELVNSQKEISKKQDDYFEELFAHMERLETKLKEMDGLVNKINSLEATIERSRPKTPQEKLELRSLDSGPYNQKLSDFFIDKEQDLAKSGKNEYVLTSDEAENFSDSEIRGSFNMEPQRNFGI